MNPQLFCLRYSWQKSSCFLMKPYPFTGLLELVLLAPSVFLLAFFMACTGSGEGLFPLTSFGDSGRRSLCYLFGKYLQGLKPPLSPCVQRSELHSCALHTHSHPGADLNKFTESRSSSETFLPKYWSNPGEWAPREGRKPPSFSCQLFSVVWKVNWGRWWWMVSSRWDCTRLETFNQQIPHPTPQNVTPARAPLLQYCFIAQHASGKYFSLLPNPHKSKSLDYMGLN